MKRRSILLVIFCLLVTSAYGKLTSQFLGIKGANFLKIGLSPRVEGMGSSYVSISEADINSLYYNPAGLCGIKNMAFAFSHLDWIDNVSIEHLAYAQPVWKLKGVFSTSLTFLGLSPVIHYNDWGENIGTMSFYNLALTAGFSKTFSDFDTGIDLKFLYQKIADSNNTGLAVDIGSIYRMAPFAINLFNKYTLILRKFNIGLAIKNLGTKAGADYLPTSVEFGYSFQIIRDLKFSNTIVKPVYEWASLVDSDYKMNFGLEYLFQRIFYLRTGYKLNYDIPNNFSLGFGLRTRFSRGLIFIDYSYASYTFLEKTNRISIVLQFDSLIPDPLPEIKGKELKSPPEENYRLKQIKGFTND
ncbi:MAG: PorV/PorQ family protein [bacterium]|nr:PorV/PorQ family protein [bacterium]